MPPSGQDQRCGQSGQACPAPPGLHARFLEWQRVEKTRVLKSLGSTLAAQEVAVPSFAALIHADNGKRLLNEKELIGPADISLLMEDLDANIV